MSPLFLFIICFIFPGIGQLLLTEYKKGLLIILTNIGLGFILSSFIRVGFLSFFIPHIVCMIWAIYSMYDSIEKQDGKKIANKNIFLSTLIVLIIVPCTFFLISRGFFKGTAFITNEYFNEGKTKKQMNTITTKLEKHRNHYGVYPKNYKEFISQKPIWSHYRTDAWKVPYRYELTDSIHYKLTSAGKDGVFNTGDDLIESNSLDSD